MIRAFWAFEPPGAADWPIRRVRRYLNWFWRREQIERASNLGFAVPLLAKKPAIEVAGLAQKAIGQEVYVNFDSRDPTKAMEVAVVLENERVLRCAAGEVVSTVSLFEGLKERDYEKCQAFFKAVGDQAGE